MPLNSAPNAFAVAVGVPESLSDVSSPTMKNMGITVIRDCLSSTTLRLSVVRRVTTTKWDVPR